MAISGKLAVHFISEWRLMSFLMLGLLALCTSFLLTWGILAQLGPKLLDIPSNRSLHKAPTPRGGGMAIALGVFAVLIGLWACNGLIPPMGLMLIPCLAMATLGVMDDFFGLGIRLRLLIQILLSGLGVFLSISSDSTFYLPEHYLLIAGCILGLVWTTNLYNFMDGINGIAAVQAITVSLTMTVILYQGDVDTDAQILLAIIGCASAGFLYWNFPNAKIFMGDSGSLFLGFTFGLLAIETSRESIAIASAWLISMAVFLVDASYTLMARLLSGQKFYHPHRSHTYQKLSLALGSHAKVTLSLLAFNILWLFPLALLVSQGYFHPALGVSLAFSPVALLAIKMKAGFTS